MTIDEEKARITVTAYWGNDDAESSISLSLDQWRSIQEGGVHAAHSESWYEGQCEEVIWSFANGLVTIDGEDGRQCIINTPLSELYVGENY